MMVSRIVRVENMRGGWGEGGRRTGEGLGMCGNGSCRRALLDVGCFEVRLRFCETAGW